MNARAGSGGKHPDDNPTPLLSLGFAALLVASGAAIGIGMAIRGGGTNGVMWGGSPVAPPRASVAAPTPVPAGFQLTGLPSNTVVLYTFARANAEVHAQVPCFCGCATMLGHRNLAECFVTPSGTWESHAAGCQVCLGEARTVMRMMGRGMAPTTIRDRIVARFGGPTLDVPTMGTSA